MSSLSRAEQLRNGESSAKVFDHPASRPTAKLEPSGQIPRGARQRRVYLPINDFLAYLTHHKTVSGIQRVQLGIVEHILGLEEMGGSEFCFVVNAPEDVRLTTIPYEGLREVVAELVAVDIDHDELRQAIARARERGAAVRPRPGDVWLFMGSFWGNGSNASLMYSLKQHRVAVGIYYYDLIPVTHPEYVQPELCNEHTQALSEVQGFVDFGLAISQFTADEVRRFIADHGFRQIPVATVPLGHSVQDAMVAGEDDADWPDSITSLQGERYVLCVCTIEVRKNHRYLFDAWKALIGEGVDVPLLVFVGRHGWRVDDLFSQFESTRYLDRRIRILHDLSDEELATLYRNCLFTAFPSLLEGWGLPIGESLSYGKACVASDTSSMPEVGGDLVDYIDPLNLRSGVATFRKFITDPAALAARETAIRDHFHGRNWNEVGANFVRIVRDYRDTLPLPASRGYAPALGAGEVFEANSFKPGGHVPALSIGERTLRSVLVENWCPPEAFGVWMAGRRGRLLFKTDLGSNQSVVVYLSLTSVPWAEDNQLLIGAGDYRTLVKVPPGRRFCARLVTTTDGVGAVDLALAIEGSIDPGEHDVRKIRIGLVSFSYAAGHDAVARIESLERLLIDGQVRVL